MKYYTYEVVDELISRMTAAGYDAVQLNEGTLGSGDWVLIAPNPLIRPHDTMYNFVIREVALNAWSSGHTIRRCAKLSKKVKAEVDKAIESELVPF